ncbi:transcription factor BIM2-like isoform X2 [Phalaenopsis equestris]|uniref:transcription factor BIM2-like isoform X2 n=1 Tax=Phalaenopsis equestris TaxID=78828 RepID=UPI0009E2D7E2|nr:transcription factor BIM2-like isoform X2 [Phalaenopsis equestris]
MESVSRFSKVFEDEDDDDEEYGKREGSPNKGLTLKIDGRSINQKVSTPRSKHSATEQRRRSKINDRFQILRELLPNSDQKRDKASFLLEVIEYIRFLHEKVQKFQSLYPGWSDENTKFMTWPSLYPVGREPGLVHTDQTLITEADNLASQSQWMRPSSPGDCAISNDILNEHEELRVDEGTISVSCAYSQGLLNNISEALQNSGIDLSQASISVQINLGRKAGARIPKPSVSMEAKGS